MLRSSGPPVKPELKRVVDDLLREDSNFDRTENRSAHREHLVRAVEITFREDGRQLTGFSRNVSATGIGLITNEIIADKSVCLLEIARLSGSSIVMLAECRWSKPYGEKWHLSGWQFINLKR